MTTQHAEELLSAYIDGELSTEERSQVERWLAADPARQMKLAQLNLLRSTLRSLPREELPAEFPSRILHVIERDMLLREPAAARESPALQDVRREVAPSRRWLRFGMRVVAPLATAALGLLWIFNSNFFLEPQARGPRFQTDADPGDSLAPARSMAVRNRSEPNAKFDSAPGGGGAGSLQYKLSSGLELTGANDPVPPAPGPVVNSPPGAVPRLEDLAAEPELLARKKLGEQNLAELATATTAGGDRLLPALEAFLEQQQSTPDLIPVVRLYIERQTDEGRVAVSPSEGEQLMIASLHAGKFRSLSVSADEGVEEVSADEGVEEFAFRDPAGSSPPFTAGIKDPLLLVVGDFDAVKSWWEQVRTRDEVESKIRVVAEVELQRFAQQVDGLNDEIEAATQRYVGQREEAISAARARTREGVARAAERGEQEARSDSPVGVLAQLLHAPDSFRRSGARKAVEFGMPAKAGSGALPEPADQPRSLQADRKEDLGLDAVGGGGGGAQGAPTAVAKMSRRSVAASRGRQPARLVMQFMARPPGPEPVSDAGLQPVADSAAVGDPADPRPDAVPLPEMEPR